jgi:hypothetical protein
MHIQIRRGDRIKGSKKGEKECGDLTQKAEEEDRGCLSVPFALVNLTHIGNLYIRYVNNNMCVFL